MDIAPPAHLAAAGSFAVPHKLLMGPGPSNASARVLAAMAQPLLGHMHPETFRLMDDCKAAAQYALQTRNALTLCVSASGHGAMEAAMCNLLEPGDRVLLLVTGIWGVRAGDMARRYGADVHFLRTARMGADFSTRVGEALPLAAVAERVAELRPAVVFVTQGDSSTGVLQPVEGLGELCRKYARKTPAYGQSVL